MSLVTYVISLKNEKKRRDSIREKLYNIHFSFVDAIDLRTVSESMLQAYIDNESNGSLIKRKLTRGEIGCSLSHFLCYKKFLETNESFCWIIEDDAILELNAHNKLLGFTEVFSEDSFDAVILGYSKLEKSHEKIFYIKEPLKILKKFDSFSLGKPWKNWTCGTVSYLITRKGAQKMLSDFDGKVKTVADDWEYFERKLNLDIYHLRPLLIFEDYIRLGSSIEDERKLVANKERRFLDILRLLRGVYRKCIMNIFNF
ncbi:glycosyltransferase family 25 protein [Hafnia paralvei]|uniref:glycosyltransferase family 25 protein n=1 Tax=Hafnia paralvei TaxID=546367 RepID=UPI00163CC127|nr:glycosyltransferase family 25 protein [Hafnia paralvei]